MITYDRANDIIGSLHPFTAVERIPITSAIGRVLAVAVVAPNDMPLFDRSAMDGIALNYDSLSDVKTLTVAAEVAAGTVFSGELQKVQCVKIMTGAPVPACCDTVIRKEYCSNYDTKAITVDRSEPKGSNIAYTGEDYKAGDILLPAGTVIQEFTIGTFASVGLMYADVIASPRCAVFSTGDEVREPFEPLAGSSIRNINAYGVMAQLHSNHIEHTYGGIVPDTRTALQDVIADHEQRFDVLLFSGGVSEGDKDYLPVLLKDMGYTILYHGMNVKPGKPQLCARKGNTLVFGLPGNPVSTILSMRLFVLPALRRLMGHPDPFEQWITGAWTAQPKTLHDKYHFIPVTTVSENGLWKITPLRTNGSGDINANAVAHGYACVIPGFDGSESPFFFL